MSIKERIFLICIPVLIVMIYLLKTPPQEASGKEERIAFPTGWREVKDDPSEVIHLRWLMGGTPQSDPRMIEVMRRRWNLEIEPVFLSPEAMMQAQPLMLSAGDIPDVFDPGPNLRKYAEHGYLMELPLEMLADHAPNLLQELNRYIPNIWVSNMWQERNYGIRPWVWHDGEMPRLGIWRMDWMRAVGINKVPETLEEYETALRRFRFNDPDGNGKQDTYGMTGDLTADYVTFTEIFGAFGVMPYNFMLQDGQVVWGGVLPGAKEALALLHRWYQEGLIHPEFLTDRWYREVNTKFFNGEVGYVNYMSSYEAFREDVAGTVAAKMKTLQPGSELAPAVAPIGPGGERGHRVWGGAGTGGVFVFGRHMAERPRAVIRFLKMLDDLIEDEAAWRDRYLGEQGVHWTWRDSETGHDEGIYFLPPYDDPKVRGKVGLPSDEIFINGTRRELYEKYLPAEMVAWNLKHRNREWGRTDVFYAPGAVEMEEGVFTGDLNRLQMTVYADIIRGERPLDAFDDFVDEWYRQGGQDWLDAARKTYALTRSASETVKELTR